MEGFVEGVDLESLLAVEHEFFTRVRVPYTGGKDGVEIVRRNGKRVVDGCGH